MTTLTPLPEVSAFIARAHGNFIDGTIVGGAAQLTVLNPATGQPLAQAANATAQEVDQAVQNARAAFDDGRWANMRPAERERILLKLADLVEANGEAIAQLETLNQGKSIHLARAIDVSGTLEFMRYTAGWATKLDGEALNPSIAVPPGAQYTAWTRREPVGVVAGIVPWNFPFMIAAWKAIPALVAGCSVVLKPSPETPLSALRLAELALEAGLPPGVLNVVTGNGATGQALVSHPLVAKVSFTGSTATGKQVGHAALDHMARFTLELGGKNPMLVFADANIENAIGGLMLAGLANQGQICASASRIYVQRPIYEAFVAALTQAVGTMRVGEGMDEQATITPVISQRQQEKIEGYLQSAQQEGARFACGGGKLERPGFFVNPTVLADVRQDMQVAREEIFGPVLSVIPFDTDEEAVQFANDTPYGLGASVWTQDLTRSMRLVRQIQAGTVWVNTHVLLDPSMPFGGFKQSGMGREFGRHSVEACTEIKSVCIAH